MLVAPGFPELDGNLLHDPARQQLLARFGTEAARLPPVSRSLKKTDASGRVVLALPVNGPSP
jgi:hypothetical protein